MVAAARESVARCHCCCSGCRSGTAAGRRRPARPLTSGTGDVVGYGVGHKFGAELLLMHDMRHAM